MPRPHFSKHEFITRERPGKGIRGADRTGYKRLANIVHVSLELRCKTGETISSPLQMR